MREGAIKNCNNCASSHPCVLCMERNALIVEMSIISVDSTAQNFYNISNLSTMLMLRIWGLLSSLEMKTLKVYTTDIGVATG